MRVGLEITVVVWCCKPLDDRLALATSGTVLLSEIYGRTIRARLITFAINIIYTSQHQFVKRELSVKTIEVIKNTTCTLFINIDQRILMLIYWYD